MGNANGHDHVNAQGETPPREEHGNRTHRASPSTMLKERILHRRSSSASAAYQTAQGSPRADEHGPKKMLSNEGHALFAGVMSAQRGQGEANQRPNLADVGAGIFNSGLIASNKARIQQFAHENGAICANCVGGEAPRWCVLGFGVFVCDDCAGAFRALPASVHGGVRSIYLDDWTDDMCDSVIGHGGNDAVNAILEHHVPGSVNKPRKGVSRGENRKEWVNRKYNLQQFKLVEGRPPLKAVAAQPTAQQTKAESFMAGRELMVGVIDITVLQVQDLPHSVFSSRRLFGGFVLIVSLGRFRAETISSFSGRKWLGQRMHLSWDGHSPLQVVLKTGSGKNIGKVSRELSELRIQGNRSLVIDLQIQQPAHKGLLEEMKIKGTDSEKGPSFTTVSLRLDFVDLRS